MRLIGSNSQMVELPLGLSPSERVHAIERGQISKFVRHVQSVMTRLRHEGPETKADSFAFGDADAAPQTESRIKHAPDGIGQGPTFVDGNGRAQTLPATEKPRAIGFELNISDGLTLDGRQMSGPNFGLLIGFTAPGREQNTFVGDKFSFNEQLGKSGMGGVIGVRCEHKLRIGSEFYLTGATAEVGQANAADFPVAFRGNANFHHRSERTVFADEFGATLGEGDAVGIGVNSRRLVAGRPNLAASRIAQEDTT